MTTTIDPADVRKGAVLMHEESGNPLLVHHAFYCYNNEEWLVQPEDYDNSVPLLDCRPVPLSEAVLRACGFDDSAFRFTAGYTNRHHLIGIEPDGCVLQPFCTNDKDCWIRMRSLHELQDVCRVFKTDLHIDLAKLKEVIK